MNADQHGVSLLVIRHGEQERIGQDGPLTARGRRQATAVAGAVSLTAADALICSSRVRARQTAEALGPAAEVIDDLDEYRFAPTGIGTRRIAARTWRCGGLTIAREANRWPSSSNGSIASSMDSFVVRRQVGSSCACTAA
jgi:broad specificity phosphatase PhoE